MKIVPPYSSILNEFEILFRKDFLKIITKRIQYFSPATVNQQQTTDNRQPTYKFSLANFSCSIFNSSLNRAASIKSSSLAAFSISFLTSRMRTFN